MSYAVRVICRPEVSQGFGLAGLRVSEAENGSDAAARLHDLLTDRETGIVLTQQRLYDDFPDDVRKSIARRPLPMIVPFPDPSRETKRDAAEAYIIELLRQVVGYRVRLR